MKINRKEAILIVVLLFLISGAVYYYYYLVPTMEEIKTINDAMQENQIKIISMETSISQIDSMKEEIELLEEKIQTDTLTIPKGISQPLQLAEVTNILNDPADSLVVVFDQNSTTFEDYQKNLVDLNFATTYENLLLILEQFRELSMTNQVVTMNVMSMEDPLEFFAELEDGNYLNVGMMVEFYSFYKDPNAEPPLEQEWEVNKIGQEDPFRPSND